MQPPRREATWTCATPQIAIAIAMGLLPIAVGIVTRPKGRGNVRRRRHARRSSRLDCDSTRPRLTTRLRLVDLGVQRGIVVHFHLTIRFVLLLSLEDVDEQLLQRL